MKSIGLILIIQVFLSSFTLAQIISEIDSLEHAIILSPDNESKVYLLLLLSSKRINNDFQKALQSTQAALKLAVQLNDYQGQIQSNFELSKIYKQQNDIKRAFDYLNTAKYLALEEDYSNEYAQSLYLIARIYVEMGEFEKTAEASFEALQIFEENQNHEGICDVLNIIGGNFYMQGEFEEAEKQFLRSIAISREHNYLKGLGKGLTNISAVFNGRGETEKAIEYVYTSNKIFKQIGDQVSEGVGYINIAIYYLGLNELDSAFKYSELSMKVNEDINNNRNIALSHFTLARCYQVQQDTSLFSFHMKKAFYIANKNGLKSIAFNATTILQDFYATRFDYDSAYKFGRIQYNLKDSLDRDNSLTRLSQLQMVYEIEKEEQERKLKDQRREFYIGLIILGLITCLILLLFIVSRSRIKAHLSKLKQEKLEDELHLKHQELAANVMALMKKNEMLSDINDRLIDVRENALSDETKNAITKIAFEIENNTQEKIWEEFEMRFKQVHSDFYDQLMKLYPDLTSNEVRLCAFLKLNLSTKEISSITGQSPRSLEVARYRLRKKMNITSSSINLSTHINQV